MFIIPNDYDLFIINVYMFHDCTLNLLTGLEEENKLCKGQALAYRAIHMHPNHIRVKKVHCFSQLQDTSILSFSCLFGNNKLSIDLVDGNF